MRSLGILLVLSAITTTAHSIICKSCWHFSDQPCPGYSMTCSSDDDVCSATYSLVSVVGTDTPQYSLSCGKRTGCNVTGSISFIYGKVRTGTSCCDTDNCDPPTPQLPANSTQWNGLMCSSCYSDTSEYCLTSDVIPCTGEETKCGRMSRKLTGTITLSETIRGCSTSSFCDKLGTYKSSISGLNVDSKMYCSDGATDLHGGVFFSALAFLLAKLLI